LHSHDTFFKRHHVFFVNLVIVTGILRWACFDLISYFSGNLPLQAKLIFNQQLNLVPQALFEHLLKVRTQVKRFLCIDELLTCAFKLS